MRTIKNYCYNLPEKVSRRVGWPALWWTLNAVMREEAAGWPVNQTTSGHLSAGDLSHAWGIHHFEAIFSCGIVNILRQSSVRAPYAMSLKVAMFTKNIVQIVTTVQCLLNIGFIRLCLEYGSNVTFYVRILDHKDALIYRIL
jgi:hypothetical protein